MLFPYLANEYEITAISLKYQFCPLNIYSGIELLDLMIILLKNLRNFHIIFHSTYINLHSQQQYTRVPFFFMLVSIHYLLSLLMTAILRGVRCYFIVTLTCFPCWLVRSSTFSCTCWLFVCLPWLFK